MSTRDLFHNASIKLTSTYLIIIMVISLVFSIGIYRVSSQELERSFRRPESPVEQLVIRRNVELHSRLLAEQNEELSYAQNRLKANLATINLLIFVTGGFLSYYLARRSLKPIEEAHNAQSRFTADASHELRTPITAMRAETELTLTEPSLKLADAKKQLISNIEELDKLTTLSDGLLRLARLDNNGLETTKENLADIINEAVERVKPLVEAKKQLIKTSRILKSIVIQAEKSSIVEAVVTLLENAVKYSPTKTQIQIATKLQNRSVEIIITDKGAGIEASDLPHIFDRFYRADQSRNKSQVNGYGIGLSIAKATVEAHGGKISVKSTPKKGSTFTITLPR